MGGAGARAYKTELVPDFLSFGDRKKSRYRVKLYFEVNSIKGKYC